MRRPPALLIVLAVIPTIATARSGTEPASGRQVVTHPLDRLTMREALALNGRRARFRVVLDSLPDDYDGQTLYDCLTAGDLAGSVFLAPGEQVREGGEVLAVEATVRVYYHPAAFGEGGALFPAFWEVRLVEARRTE
jgi:hypothetical protein